jgi:hypothetical protein
MNRITLVLLLLASLKLQSCPTCMGRITPASPPFFSDEFYIPTHESMDELYQKVVNLPATPPPSTTVAEKEAS